MKKSSKYWLLGSIFIIVINLIFFIFRNYVDQAVLFWVVILTPVACLILYPVTSLLDRNKAFGDEKGS
jgi:membrane protein required for beta-lactamase induction